MPSPTLSTPAARPSPPWTSSMRSSDRDAPSTDSVVKQALFQPTPLSNPHPTTTTVLSRVRAAPPRFSVRVAAPPRAVFSPSVFLTPLHLTKELLASAQAV